MGLVISGAAFGAVQGITSSVTLGNTPMTVVAWTNSFITVQVPPIGAGSGTIVVYVNGVPMNAGTFTVAAPVGCPTP